MTARTHDIAAFTGLIIVLGSVDIQPISTATIIASLIANQIGGIIPDIDQPTAPFWRNLPIGGYFGKIFSRLLGGHRFITHSLVGLILVGWLLSVVLQILSPIMGTINLGYVWWSCMIGIVSHLVLDSFTKEGVPWLLPIPFKFGFPPLKIFRITTGKKAEYLLFVPLLIIVLIVSYSMTINKISSILAR